MNTLMRIGIVGLGMLFALRAWAGGQADYVVAISVDGMGSSYMHSMIAQGRMPNLKRIQAEGASTENARTDYDISVTLPNHTAMVTGRPVLGEAGHGWTWNVDPKPGQTLHSSKGAYVPSVFDVAHDAGLRTGMWASKSKFSLYRDSYDQANGSPDGEGAARFGRNKLDIYHYDASSLAMTDHFIAQMKQSPCNFAFVHFADPDAAGHAKGWGSPEYQEALARVDACIGQVLDLLASDPQLRDKTVLIVTADHGGFEKNHADATLPLDYTIPFLLWGAGVQPGDLYSMNPTRQNPLENRPGFDAPLQPIRNGDVANLSLKLLGLPPIPSSTIGKAQDLKTASPAKPMKKAA